MTTAERWAGGRPVREALPGMNEAYQTQVGDWLTEFSDSVLIRSKFIVVDDGERQVDPLSCDVLWLDLLAPLCGWYGYWDESWPETSKRQLLANSYTKVWPYHGTSGTLSFVLNTLGITHVITQGESFIIGRNEVGDALGEIAWQYDIVLPTSLFQSDEARLARRINRLFGPLWTKSQIIFDDSYFSETGFPLFGDGLLLAVDDQQTVLRL